MRLRAMLAGLVAMLMLTVPCLASTCQLACALKAQGPACHEVSTAGLAAMTGMSDCGTAALAAELKAPRCSHASYDEQPAAMGDGSSSALVAGVYGAVVVVARGMSLPGVGLAARGAAETPPFRSALLVSLQSCLRV